MSGMGRMTAGLARASTAPWQPGGAGCGPEAFFAPPPSGDFEGKSGAVKVLGNLGFTVQPR
jgi:hypothetical protein